MITRRTVLRTHLFRPDERLCQFYLFALGVCANRFGIEVIAVVLMSTHEHLIVRDTTGRLPDFLRELHRLVALGVKILRKWDGAVWDHEKASVVELRTHKAIVEKLAYLMANPVTAGLVTRAHEWPGINTTPKDLGVAQWTVRRPDIYFDDENPAWPEQVTLKLAMPEVGLPGDKVREWVAQELKQLESKALDALKEKHQRVLGAENILRSSPFDQATSSEPLRDRNPHFAVGRSQREAYLQAVQVLRAFRSAYHEAMAMWRTGLRSVVFPPGTWLMRTLHGACVASG